MIIHASLKTDITYFYMKWFIERLKEGYVDIPSDKPGKIKRYDFQTNPIEKIYLHTKNPYKIIKDYKDLKVFDHQYEVVTHLTMYDKFYEPKIAEKNKIFDYIRKTALLVGKDNNSLCYGPIFKTISNDASWHINQFKFLCLILNKSISTIYYDFSINGLCKTVDSFNASEFTLSEQEYIIEEFKKIADQYNLVLKRSPAIETLNYDEIDIGEPNTCPAGCKHCKYITNSKSATIKSGMHSDSSSLLIGKINAKDKIINIKIEEPKVLEEDTGQYSLFDLI